jgi:DNA invertase Pin-like site-specific DNA recombinase
MATNKKLRFAALIRVSTDRQSKQGESLNTQTDQIETAVEMLGGVITKTYSGQEHATEGFEKKRFDELLKDAASKRKQFDAVMVADLSRWSRDNHKSTIGFDVLKKNKIRFFTLNNELDLNDPRDEFMQVVQTAANTFYAKEQSAKANINKINRAKRGIPTSGKLPYARTYDKATGKWGIDPEKHAMVKDAAKRYIAGESYRSIADEYGMDDTHLWTILNKKSGEDWSIKFKGQVQDFKIPRLLPQKTIERILKQSAANKTFKHGSIKNNYLLARMIFCERCGYAMSGQTRRNGSQFYRHLDRQVKKCDCPKRRVPADVVEANVIRQLFETFGNPKAVKAAIEKATPNKAKNDQAIKRQEVLAGLLKKVDTGIQRIIGMIANDTITDEDAKTKLDELKTQKAKYHNEMERLTASLENVPDPKDIKAAANAVAKRTKLSAKKSTALRYASHIENMTYMDKRTLAEQVFGGMTPDGKRQGVYISWHKHKGQWIWKYSIRGQIDVEGIVPMSANDEGVTKLSLSRR